MPGSSPLPLPPSGAQHVIGHGRQVAVVTEVGATLRSYRVADEAVVDGFDQSELASGGRGQVLAPWPNRLGDGRYSFEGRSGRAPLDEPERRNAIHGLVRWMPWWVESSAQNVVVLACVLHPQPAYPWRLELSVEYRLGREGLTVVSRATNRSEGPAPLGVGFHPYLTVGPGGVDAMRLALPARRRLVTDERGLPTGDAAVAGTEFDFTGGRVIGPTRLDTAYSELSRGDNGMARVQVDHVDGGRGLTLWLDDAFRYVMAYTGDAVEPPGRRRQALALEPMTCPPDALRSGTDLVVLEPDASWRGSWGITPR